MAINGKNRKLGFFGERRAAKYLKKQGYEILERNYKCPFGEVDIIAKKGDVVAFVEVKTRSSDYFGTPGEAVNGVRRKRYANSAKFYFSGRDINCTVRFDVLEILQKQINYIENAFNAC
jgi:putative endonuclease